MNKKTKLLSIFILAGVISSGVAVGVTGCKKHSHNWSDTYSVQENGKHAKTCDGCDKLSDEHDAKWTDENDTTCDHDGCTVTRTVTPPSGVTVTGVTVSAAGNATSVVVDGTLQLTATVTGTGDYVQTVTWSTTSDKIELNTSTGLVTGKTATTGDEKVTIRATSTADPTKYGEIQITVTPKTPGATVTVDSVSITEKGTLTSIEVDETKTLHATVTGTGNPAQTVTWSTTSDKVELNATTGAVKGKTATTGNEKVTIRATSTVDPTKYDEIQITVVENSNYDMVTTDINFDAVAKEIDPAASGSFPIPETYTYKGKVTFTATGKSRFEVGNNRFNTQGESGTIIIKLSGITNSLTIKGTNASGGTTQVSLSLTKDGSPVASTPAVTPSTAFEDIVLTDLPAGTYTLTSVGGSARITTLTLVEKLEKSAASGITVTANNVDYLKGTDFSANGLAVALNYSNGRTDALSANDYTIDDSQYNKNVAGKYTITVKYKDNPSFSDTFDVYVYTIDTIQIHTIGIVSNKQVTVQQAITTGGTLNSNYLTVQGTGTVGEGDAARTHTFNLPAGALEITLPSTTTVGLKTANILVDTAYTTGGKTLSGSYDVVVKDKINAENGKVEVEVGKTRDLQTLTQAIQYLKACDLGDAEKIIRLDEDEYTEKVWIDMDNVTLIGSGETDQKPDPTKTSIVYSLVEGDKEPINGNLWGLDCATVHVEGAKGFKAYNIEIRNDFDYIKNAGNYSGSQSSQGVALTLNGDGAVIANCHLYGNQDTLYMESGRSYYYKTQIDGNVDFIFGGETGLAYFDECKIVAINRTEIAEGQTKGKAQNGYVTAAKHSSAKKPDYGYIFYKCEMTDDGKVADGAMSLGRSWGDKATVAYIECNFSAAYSKKASDDEEDKNKDHRWADWGGGTKAENADFKEYGSTGDGAITTAVKGGKVISATEAADHTAENLFGATNGKKVNADYTTWDYKADYLALMALVNGQTLATYTVTIKDTEGNTLGVPQTYTEGQTLSADSIKNYVNNLDSVKNADKEVDKVYSSYTDSTNNTELVTGLIEEFDGLVGESCDIIVSLKTIAVKTYNLLGYDGGTLQSGATGEYLGIKIETPNGGKFSNRGSDIQINAGTVLKVPVSGYSKVYMVDYQDTNTYAGSVFTLSFDTVDTQLYCVVTFKASFYAHALVVDNTITMRKVTVNEGQTVLGDIYVENNTSVTIAQIAALIEANSVYAGKELDKVYTDVTCDTEYSDEAITEDTQLYITVKNIQQLGAITETTTITFGSSGDYKTFAAQGVADYGQYISRDSDSSTSQLQDPSEFVIKSVAGATVSFVWYREDQPEYGDDSCASVQVGADGTITISFTAGSTGGSSGIYLKSITITVPSAD